MMNHSAALVPIRRPGPAVTSHTPVSRRLIVCPPAGGGGQYARPLLQDGLQLIGARYPGREARLQEPFATSVEELADEIVAALSPILAADSVPTAVLGNSLGAVVAAEVAHRLASELPGRLNALVLAGRSAPAEHSALGAQTRRRSLLPTPDPDSASQAEVIDWLRRLDGLPEALLSDSAFVAMQVKIVRADLRLSRAATDMPSIDNTALLLLCGADDPVADLDTMQDWSAITTGPVTRVELAGAHHAVVTDVAGCHAALSQALQLARA